MLYLSAQNLYISKYFLWTQEELDYFDRVEKIYKENLKKPSFHEWLDIFPEAKNFVEKKLRSEIAQCKQDLKEADKIRIDCNKIISRALPKNQWFWELYANVLFIMPLTWGREKKIKKNVFLLSSLKPKNQNEVNSNKITEQDIIRAKECLIENFLQYNQAGFAACFLHKETTPSLKVYKKQNRWYCFSCNEGGDVIDLIQKQKKCDFIEAVKFVLHK